jgi:hypothetical protein
MLKEFLFSWFRRIKMLLLVLAAILICWRGMTYNDPTGAGVVPILMCGLMGFALLLLSLGLASKSSDPLFI